MHTNTHGLLDTSIRTGSGSLATIKLLPSGSKVDGTAITRSRVLELGQSQDIESYYVSLDHAPTHVAHTQYS